MNKALRRCLAPIVITALWIAIGVGCAGRVPSPAIGDRPAISPDWSVDSLRSTTSHERDAEGGGRVTVEVRIFAGSIPDSNMIGQPTKVAEFRNLGSRREKRYKLKPYRFAWYELVLSPDPAAGKTRWDMYEVFTAAPLVRYRHGSGHLWRCERTTHTRPGRDVAFKDCDILTIPYDPDELAAISADASSQLPRVASLVPLASAGEARRTIWNGPVWISCNSGCCSLGK